MISTVDRLDRYWAGELGCSPQALYGGGITVCSPRHRDGPRWMGWLVPLECITVEEAVPGTGVISITTMLTGTLQERLSSTPPPQEYLPPQGRGLIAFAREHLVQTSPKMHYVMTCDATTFTPMAETVLVSMLRPSDMHYEWYRLHFDGPVFVIRNDRGSIVSWSAIKCKSDDVWELAVVTEAPYRNRGYARMVVSHATQAILDAGRQPLYLHELSNYASGRVCRSLGFQHYGYELTCEAGRVTPRRMEGSW